MADIPTLEPAPEVAEAGNAGEPRKRSRLLLAIAAAIALLAAAAGAWLLVRHSPKSKAAHASRQPVGPAIYVALDPPFVTNFQANETVRFLQLAVEVMTRDKAIEDVIKANDPVIRNNLLLLFSNQKYADLATTEGKDRLRSEALAAVRQVVAADGGDASRVEAVYFTSFVMQ